jgi:hypothetical protein
MREEDSQGGLHFSSYKRYQSGKHGNASRRISQSNQKPKYGLVLRKHMSAEETGRNIATALYP